MCVEVEVGALEIVVVLRVSCVLKVVEFVVRVVLEVLGSSPLFLWRCSSSAVRSKEPSSSGKNSFLS